MIEFTTDKTGAKIYYGFEQYSPSWWEIRRGMPTASEMGEILTPKTLKMSAAADSYIARLVADTLGLEYPQKEEFESFAMRRGTRIEPLARRWLEFDQNLDVRQVGFVKSACGRFGASVDGLIGDDEILELKAPLGHTQVKYLLDGNLPSEYMGQVHGAMIVTGRTRCRFVSFCPGLPALNIVVHPNEYTLKLKESLEVFWDKYQEALKRVMGL